MGVVMTALIPSIGWLFNRNVAQGEAIVGIATQIKIMTKKLDTHEQKLDALRVEMASGFGEIKDELRRGTAPRIRGVRRSD